MLRSLVGSEMCIRDRAGQAKAVESAAHAFYRIYEGGKLALPVTEVVASVFKRSPDLLTKIAKKISSGTIPIAANGAAAYVAAEQLAANELKAAGITPEEIGDDKFGDLKYWFAGNYLSTYGFGNAFNYWGPKIPYLRTVLGKKKVMDFIYAEAATLSIIGFGTLDSWSGPAQEWFNGMVKRASDALGLEDKELLSLIHI